MDPYRLAIPRACAQDKGPRAILTLTLEPPWSKRVLPHDRLAAAGVAIAKIAAITTSPERCACESDFGV